jgi:hypothetical protein
MSCWVFFWRCSLCRGLANIAIHLSRPQSALFFCGARHTQSWRPGDGSVRHALGTATRSDVNDQADVLGVDTHALVLENSFNLA